MSGDEAMKQLKFSCIHMAMLYRDKLARNTKNTKLARDLAIKYEEIFDVKFPGGIDNAYIMRGRPGHWQRSYGVWSWKLGSISVMWREDHIFPLAFGSNMKAKDCLKDTKLLDDIL